MKAAQSPASTRVQIDGLPLPKSGVTYCRLRRDTPQKELWMPLAVRLFLELSGWTNEHGVCKVRRSVLMRALGLMPEGDPGTDAYQAALKAGTDALKKATKKLRDVGAIERIKEGHGRAVSIYLVNSATIVPGGGTVIPLRGGSETTLRGGTVIPLRGGVAIPQRGGTPVPHKRGRTKEPLTTAREFDALDASPAGGAERRQGSAPPAAIERTATEDAPAPPLRLVGSDSAADPEARELARLTAWAKRKGAADPDEWARQTRRRGFSVDLIKRHIDVDGDEARVLRMLPRLGCNSTRAEVPCSA